MIEKQLFSKDECDFILNSFESEWIVSKVGKDYAGNFVEDTELRESQTKTLYTKDNTKLSELLLNKLSEFNVVELPIQIQLLKYEVGGHFKKHRDTLSEYNTQPPRHSTIIIYLNEDYEGGNLSVWDYVTDEEYVAERKIGNSVMFESKCFHAASKVLSGTRYVLVLWVTSEGMGNKPTLI